MMTYDDLQMLYKAGDWAERRLKEQEWQEWLSGERIREAEAGKPDDKTGERAKLYPLSINPFKIVAESHTDIVIGVLPDHDAMPVQIHHEDKEFERVLREILEDSNFPSMIVEQILKSQARGGFALKVSWEPQATDLRWRVRLLPLNGSEIWPLIARGDPWNFLECYVGYEIDKDVAERQYGIKIDGYTGLYIEHWDRDEYQIMLDGKQVYTMVGSQSVPLRGKHNLGRVPIVYIPHIRDGSHDVFGTSHVEDIIGIAKEINSTTPDVGDAVHDNTHLDMIGGNFRGKQVERRPILDENRQIIGYYLYTGDSPLAQGSQPPFLDYPKRPDIPQGAGDYINWLWGLIQRGTRTAGAVMGEIDFSSGRVVGTVMSQLAAPTIAHTQRERGDIATGMNHVAKIVRAMLKAHARDLERLDVKVPDFSEQLANASISVTWHPAIAVEATESNRMLNEDFQYGTRSLESVLKERGVKDVDEEAKRIWADMKKKAEIEAQAQIKMKQMELEQQKTMLDQQMQFEQEKHDQDMEFRQEDHDLKKQQQAERAKQQAAAPRSAPSGR